MKETLAVADDFHAMHGDKRWARVIAQTREAAGHASRPEHAAIRVEDVDRFWRAYDLARNSDDPRGIFEREYIDAASPALQSFFPKKIGPVEDLLKTVEYYRRYYEAVRLNTLRIRAIEPQLRSIFLRLYERVPGAIFPDVTFVIGRLSAAGTATADGLVIGAEQASFDGDMPIDRMPLRQRQILSRFDRLPQLIAHELSHFQQHFADDDSLLAAALREGGADFVGELVSGSTANESLRTYGDAHEPALWDEFRADMTSTDEHVIERWLWGTNATNDRPGDLGYYVGYRIVRAYYERSIDKRRAVREILDLADARAFVASSGYSPR